MRKQKGNGHNDYYGQCFACGRKLQGSPPFCLADTRDDQTVLVGQECYKKILASGQVGYQPPQGGPKLWDATPDQKAEYAQQVYSKVL
jgi:hypothetical protein